MFGLYIGKKKLHTHQLKTRSDAMHHVNDLKRTGLVKEKISIRKVRAYP